MGWAAASALIGTAISGGASIYQAEQARRSASAARRQQDRIQGENEARALRTRQEGEQQVNAQQQNTPDIASLLDSSGQFGGGLNSTVLSGPLRRPIGGQG